MGSTLISSTIFYGLTLSAGAGTQCVGRAFDVRAANGLKLNILARDLCHTAKDSKQQAARSNITIVNCSYSSVLSLACAAYCIHVSHTTSGHTFELSNGLHCLF